MNLYELQLLDMIQKIRSPFLDIFMKYITVLGDSGIFWIILGLALALYSKTRKVGITIIVGLILHLLVINLGIKPLVHRIRPFNLNTSIQLLVKIPSDYSFPSGHTAAGIVSVTVLFLYGYKKQGIIALILASLIAFSRLYLYVHYPTDVLAGIVIGIVLGYVGYVLTNYFYNKRSEN